MHQVEVQRGGMAVALHRLCTPMCRAQVPQPCFPAPATALRPPVSSPP